MLGINKNIFCRKHKWRKKMLMIRTFKWWFGFVASTLLLTWAIVFQFILATRLSMGPGLLLLFLTLGLFILLLLLMVLFVFFRRPRPISYGLAVPFLVLQIGVLAQVLSELENPVLMDSLPSELGNPLFIINLLGWAALLIVIIIYLARSGSPPGGRPTPVPGVESPPTRVRTRRFPPNSWMPVPGPVPAAGEAAQPGTTPQPSTSPCSSMAGSHR
jgi:hypothetical protein